MALKLLNRTDSTITSEEMGVSFKLGNLLPEHVGELLALRHSSANPAISMAIFAMRECMSMLTISGEDYNPRNLSFQLDTSDKESRAVCHVIAAEIIKHVLLDEETRKKLQQQLEISSKVTQENDA